MGQEHDAAQKAPLRPNTAEMRLGERSLPDHSTGGL